MTTATYSPVTLEALLARPCGCGAQAWAADVDGPTAGIVFCAECGAWLRKPLASGLTCTAAETDREPGDATTRLPAEPSREMTR